MPITLGDVQFGLGADTAALQKSVDKLARFGKEVEKVSRRQSDSGKELAAQMRKQEAAMTRALQQTLALSSAVRRNKGSEDLANQATMAWNKYVQAMTRSTVGTLQFQRANERLTASLGTVRRSLGDIIQAQRINQMNGFVQTLKDLGAMAVLINGPLGGMASRIGAVASIASRGGAGVAAFAAGVAGAVIAVNALGSAVLNNARQLDAARGKFEALTNSTALSNTLFEEARKIADKSGQAIQSLSGQYANFLAAAQGTNLAGEKSQKIFTTFAMVMGKLRTPTEQVQGTFKALEQMMSKGTIQAEELRNQLGDRLVGAVQQAAKAMGMTTKELSDLMKQGQLTTSEFLEPFAEQLAKAFNIDGSNITGFQASLNKLNNSWSNLLDKIDMTFGVSKTAISGLNALAGSFDTLAKNIHIVENAAIVAAGAMAAFYAPALIGGIATLARTLLTLRTALAGVAIAANLFPGAALVTVLGRIALAAAGGATAVALFGRSASDAAVNVTDLTKKVEDYISATNKGGDIGGIGGSTQAEIVDAMKATQEEMTRTEMRIREKSKSAFYWLLGITGPVDTLNMKLKDQQTVLQQLTNLHQQIGDQQDWLAVVRSVEDMGRAIEDGAEKAAKMGSLMAELSYHQQRAALAAGGHTDALKRLESAFAINQKVEDLEENFVKAGDSAEEAAYKANLLRAALSQEAEAGFLKDAAEEARKLEEAFDRVINMVEEWDTKMKEAEGSAVRQIEDLDRQMAALGSGGIKGLEELNAQLDREEKVRAYAKALEDANVSADRAGELTQIWADKLGRLDEQTKVAKVQQQAVDAYNQTVIDGINGVSDALVQMGRDGDWSAKKVVDAFIEMGYQIARTHMQMAILNPMMKSMGLDSGNQLPTSGGPFASSGSDNFFSSLFSKAWGYISGGGGSSGGGIPGLGFGGGTGTSSNSWISPDTGINHWINPDLVARQGMVMESVRKLAKGGTISRATRFNTANGPVIGGEAGTEAIMPLGRTSSGDLGVMLAGGMGAGNTVVKAPDVHVTTVNVTDRDSIDAIMKAGINNQMTTIINNVFAEGTRRGYFPRSMNG